MELLLKTGEYLSEFFFWLTGPILDKELRVLSRRKRYYFLRFCYIGLLAFFVLIFYFGFISMAPSSRVLAVSRMPEAGKTIAVMVIWFQFLASQLMAVTFLSTSISEEIYKRTLGALMTTPINSLQIVLGKLFSRLLQIFLLLGVSVPVLSITRILGGVTWDYVISSFFIIICSTLFAGTVSLFFSIFSRQAFSVLLRVMIFFLVLYGLIPLSGYALSYSWGVEVSKPVLLYFNPFAVLGANTAVMMAAGTSSIFSWRLHCFIMLAAAGFFVVLSAFFVRWAGLQQMAGWWDSGKDRWSKKIPIPFLAKAVEILGPVKGPPLVWKDMRLYLANAGKLKSIIFNAIFVTVLVFAYVLCFQEGLFEEGAAHIGFICIFLFIGMWRTATISASSISAEREARTWEILMTAPFTNKQIVLSKIAVSVLPAVPYILLIFGHVLFFSFLGQIHLAAIFPLILIIVFSFFLVSSAGVMSSCLFRRTMWAVGFSLFLLLCFHFSTPCSFFANPLFLVGMLLSFTAGTETVSKFFERLDYVSLFIGLGAGMVILLFYFMAGLACYAVSRSQVRMKVYT